MLWVDLIFCSWRSKLFESIISIGQQIATNIIKSTMVTQVVYSRSNGIYGNGWLSVFERLSRSTAWLACECKFIFLILIYLMMMKLMLLLCNIIVAMRQWERMQSLSYWLLLAIYNYSQLNIRYMTIVAIHSFLLYYRFSLTIDAMHTVFLLIAVRMSVSQRHDDVRSRLCDSNVSVSECVL